MSQPNDHKTDQDPHPQGLSRFLGRTVSFDDPTGGPSAKRFVGVVEAGRYLGRTELGKIPDYRLTVRGKSGKVLEVSLVEQHLSFQ